MTIRRGEDWGTLGPLGAAMPVVDSDHALARVVAAGRTECGLTGGDLARTVGARSDEAAIRTGDDRARLPIDVGWARIDGRELAFVAHLVVRGPLWAHAIAVMNAAFIGDWNLAPRAHPNDGRLDLLRSTLSLGDRVKARSRLHDGSHVPHPGLSVSRVREGTLAPHPNTRLWVDGRRIGRVEYVEFRVEPDAFTIVV